MTPSPNKRGSCVLDVKKGSAVVCEGRAATVLAAASPSDILIRITGTNEERWVKAGDLTSYSEAGQLPTLEVLPTPSREDLEQAVAWVNAFDAHVRGNGLGTAELAEIANSMSVSRRTVSRRLARYLQDPTPASQLGSAPGPHRGQLCLPPAVEAIIERAIEAKYECAERGTIVATTLEARRMCAAAGLRKPSYGAVRARVRRRDQWKSARKRHGRVRGDARAAPAGSAQACRYDVLDFVQIDHAIVDLIVVDAVTREEVGRPWITLAIDVATRCVLGFHLSFDSPSQTSVALALEHSCCPKDKWLSEQGIKGDWHPMGLMRVVGWDNATSFTPSTLMHACATFGIEAKYRRVKTPTHGAHIERYIGTYMGALHMLKGTTFSSTKDRGDYQSERRATMSIEELTAWSVHQINGVYHNTRHSELGRTPLEAWRERCSRSGEYRIPRYPADRRAFRLALLPGAFRRVGRQGVNRFHLRYWDDALIPLIGDGKKYWVAHDPRNISKIYLRLNDRFVDVPWADRARRPCALFELELAKKIERKKHDGPYCEARVFEHLAAMEEIERTADRMTRAARRNRARRPADDRGEAPCPPPAVDYTVEPVVLSDPWEMLYGYPSGS